MENKAIKCCLILVVTLFLGFFIIGEVKALTFTETFDTYNIGNLTGQGGWTGSPACWVDTIKSYSGTKSISVIDNFSTCIATKEIDPTTIGFTTILFYAETKEVGENILYYLGGIGSGITIQNAVITFSTQNLELPNSDNWLTDRWHRVGIEFNLLEGWGRARFNLENWTPTTTIEWGENITSISLNYNNAFREEQDFFIDNITFANSYDEYTYGELGLPELPELEECEGLTITERLLCELKNFFYRLFVPSPEKITELRISLDTIKTKFPYSYVVEIKNFFTFIKNNINENETTFKILGQEGTINFAFWSATTTLANSTQSFVDIFKKITTFIIILLFGFWLLTFLRRIFK